MSMLPEDWQHMTRAANAAGWCLSYQSDSGGPWRCVAWRVVPSGSTIAPYERDPNDDTPLREIGDFAAARAWIAARCPHESSQPECTP
jgi:hypothetical protein